MVAFGKKSFKYFTVYKDDSKKIMPLCKCFQK